MEKKLVLQEVNSIFLDILDNENIVLSYESSAKEIDEWDSLTHIQLVVAIEKHFGLRFNSKEIQTWKNVGEMIDCICNKK